MSRSIAAIAAICCLGAISADAKELQPELINDKVIAQESPSWNVGLKAGTLGIGIDISKPVSKTVSIRLNANRFTYETTDDSLYSTVLDAKKRYDLDTKGILVDFHFMQLRLTAGAYLNHNEIDYTTTPTLTHPVIFNGTPYGAGIIKRVKTEVTFNTLSPYLGIGWGNNGNTKGWGGWNLSLDAGLMYHGDPHVKIKAKLNDRIPEIIENTLNQNLAREAKNQEEDLSDFPFYPVVMIGLNYTF